MCLLPQCRLHAATHGLGTGKKLVVFLHGFPECWHSWRHQIAALKGEFEILALDMRGYGLSDAPKGVQNYSLAALCADVAAAVHAAGHHSCILVGHDWGGAVAWAFAANHPEIVDRLVVLCSPHPAAYKDPKRYSSEQSVRSWYFLLFVARWLPEVWVRSRDFELLEDMMLRHPLGPVNEGCIRPEDVDCYKAALARPGALTAAINYYRCSLKEQTVKASAELKRQAIGSIYVD